MFQYIEKIKIKSICGELSDKQQKNNFILYLNKKKLTYTTE